MSGSSSNLTCNNADKITRLQAENWRGKTWKKEKKNALHKKHDTA